MGKRIKEDDTFLMKKNKRKKNCYNNNIYGWKRDSFSSEVEITRGII